MMNNWLDVPAPLTVTLVFPELFLWLRFAGEEAGVRRRLRLQVRLL